MHLAFNFTLLFEPWDAARIRSAIDGDAIRLRPFSETFSWLESPPGTLVFDRRDMLCLVNVSAPSLALPQGQLVLASEPGVTVTLPRSTAAWVRKGTR